MILEAKDDFNIDLSESWMIGDSERDILAGKNAGCKTALLNNKLESYDEDIKKSNLKEAIEAILKI